MLEFFIIWIYSFLMLRYGLVFGFMRFQNSFEGNRFRGVIGYIRSYYIQGYL